MYDRGTYDLASCETSRAESTCPCGNEAAIERPHDGTTYSDSEQCVRNYRKLCPKAPPRHSLHTARACGHRETGMMPKNPISDSVT